MKNTLPDPNHKPNARDIGEFVRGRRREEGFLPKVPIPRVSSIPNRCPRVVADNASLTGLSPQLAGFFPSVIDLGPTGAMISKAGACPDEAASATDCLPDACHRPTPLMPATAPLGKPNAYSPSSDPPDTDGVAVI